MEGKERSRIRVDREDLWQVLKMYKAKGKLLRIKSLYVNSVACGRIKGGERECFKSNSGVSEGCIVSPCLFHVDMDGVMREVKKGIEKMGVRFLEEVRSGDCLASCMQVTWFCAMNQKSI